MNKVDLKLYIIAIVVLFALILFGVVVCVHNPYMSCLMIVSAFFSSVLSFSFVLDKYERGSKENKVEEEEIPYIEAEVVE